MERQKRWIGSVMALVLATGGLATCERVEQGADRLRAETRDAIASGKDKASRTREEAQVQLAQELDRLSEQIRALRERSGDPKEHARESLDALATELEQREKVAREKLAALVESGDGLWQRLCEDAEREADRLAEACREATSKP